MREWRLSLCCSRVMWSTAATSMTLPGASLRTVFLCYTLRLHRGCWMQAVNRFFLDSQTDSTIFPLDFTPAGLNQVGNPSCNFLNYHIKKRIILPTVIDFAIVDVRAFSYLCRGRRKKRYEKTGSLMRTGFFTERTLLRRGVPERIRTFDPQSRSLILYPAELRAHVRQWVSMPYQRL